VDGLLERDRELAAVEELLLHGGGVLVVEGGMGIGKTALLEAACRRAAELDQQVLRARGSELEREFAFGIVRQLFERRLARASKVERDELLSGPAGAVRPLLLEQPREAAAHDTSFAVLHGLYWLTATLADRRPLLIVVDDAHWADEPSLRWLAHLAPRLGELAAALIVALRPGESGSSGASLATLYAQAPEALRPELLSEGAVDALVRTTLRGGASDEVSAAVWAASAGNPLFVTVLLRALIEDPGAAGSDATALIASGAGGISERVLAGLRGRGPEALGLAQALAILGDGCELRHAAAIAGLEVTDAIPLAACLIGLGVLASDDPPRFVHPMVRAAVYGSLARDQRDAAHRAAARLLHADGAPPGLQAAHLVSVHPSGDGWVVARLRNAAEVAMRSGAPHAAAELLDRALAEPPPREQRVDVLREAARAQASAGSEFACTLLEEALGLVADQRRRAVIALEVAETYAALFRWAEAVDVIERALSELGDADGELAAQLEGELVVCGLHDARAPVVSLEHGQRR
jgi:hypothetical protein